MEAKGNPLWKGLAPRIVFLSELIFNDPTKGQLFAARGGTCQSRKFDMATLLLSPRAKKIYCVGHFVLLEAVQLLVEWVDASETCFGTRMR